MIRRHAQSSSPVNSTLGTNGMLFDVGEKRIPSTDRFSLSWIFLRVVEEQEESRRDDGIFEFENMIFPGRELF